ncbi:MULTISPECIES: PadR family transcriptional regulator [Methanobacterium]|jgi:DNA-binding PadR family transcriptional regulator|uniref:PadR family transcriptional regulator n=1 Tax=Methanobacterium veterum TaxID=408577 RepID=A0A9E5A1U1_9EURY|nr:MULTISPECIES: PadR family transcriptional regulator [Methanobacterium]MCZ3365224.1 PadR family transcriptional regulator [Methanobacterium veterum]MCZ3372979.1 PadR family transcriptional regulator [Methanobacterium veterum]
MWDNWRDKLSSLKDVHDRLEELGRLGGLRIWIIHVLEDGPKNGVEIMDAIQEHHEAMHRMHDDRMRHMKEDKHYQQHLQRAMKRTSRRPSPGSVYPMLKKMVAEELIVKQEDGRYKLTDKGQEMAHKIFGQFRSSAGQMDRGAHAVEHSLNEIGSYISLLENIKREKLIPHEERIGELSERLKKMKDSLKE